MTSSKHVTWLGDYYVRVQ